MKKVFFLILYLLSFLSTAFVGSTVFLGIRQGANTGSIAILAALALLFLAATVVFYKLYKLYKEEEGGNK